MINFEFKYLSGLHRVIELYMIPYLHFWTYFLQKKKLIFSIYFLHLIVLILWKIIQKCKSGKFLSPSEIISTNDKHIFIRILVTNLRILCFVIFAIPTICTPYYQSRLNLVEICLLNLLTFSAWGVTYILVGIIYWEF